MPKVLVVDDERHIVRILEVNFQREGFEVVVAYNGREALEVARAEMPDAIILDVVMPYYSGLEVTRQLKADSSMAHIPIIILSMKAFDEDVNRGLTAGANAYMTKPFNPGDVIEAVRRHIQVVKPE